MTDKEIEEAVRTAMLYGTSYVKVQVVDPYRLPWYARLWRWIARS